MAWQNPNLSTNKTEERRQKDASNFQKMVQMLGMARQTDGQTMLGFALGKLLRGTFDHFYKSWLDDQDRKTKRKISDEIDKDKPLTDKEKLQARNTDQLFSEWERPITDIVMGKLYNGGRSWKDDMAITTMRLASDPYYKAWWDKTYGLPSGSQQENKEKSTTQEAPSALQNFIDNRYPNYKKRDIEAVFGTPQFQTPTSISVTQNENSVTEPNGKTVSNKQTTFSNWDAMEKKNGSFGALVNKLGQSYDWLGGQNPYGNMDFLGRRW